MENTKMNGNEVLYVRSSKKKSKFSSDDTSTNGDDVWDDSLLIEAYNKAVDLAHTEVLKNMSDHTNKGKNNTVKNKKKMQWNIGDPCSCEYSEDHIYYEADILDIIDDLEMCIVKYVGYENEEKVSLKKLKPSKGEMARSVQVKQALQENSVKDGTSVEKQPGSDSHPQSEKKKHTSKKPEKTRSNESVLPDSMYLNSSHLFKPSLMGAIPPPPPPHMFGKLDDSICESDAMSAMLMSWYMSGYHTGYYQGLKAAKK